MRGEKFIWRLRERQTTHDTAPQVKAVSREGNWRSSCDWPGFCRLSTSNSATEEYLIPEEAPWTCDGDGITGGEGYIGYCTVHLLILSSAQFYVYSFSSGHQTSSPFMSDSVSHILRPLYGFQTTFNKSHDHELAPTEQDRLESGEEGAIPVGAILLKRPVVCLKAPTL